MDVYNQPRKIESMDVVFTDSVHVKSYIDNSIRAFDKLVIVFGDDILFSEVKQDIDEYVGIGVLELKTYLGSSPRTY